VDDALAKLGARADQVAREVDGPARGRCHGEGPGRLGWLPTQAPHRSGLAELPHPAPHLMIYLIPIGPPALRGHGSGLSVPGVFPFDGS
jgi:hypothetical protein